MHQYCLQAHCYLITSYDRSLLLFAFSVLCSRFFLFIYLFFCDRCCLVYLRLSSGLLKELLFPVIIHPHISSCIALSVPWIKCVKLLLHILSAVSADTIMILILKPKLQKKGLHDEDTALLEFKSEGEFFTEQLLRQCWTIGNKEVYKSSDFPLQSKQRWELSVYESEICHILIRALHFKLVFNMLISWSREQPLPRAWCGLCFIMILLTWCAA